MRLAVIAALALPAFAALATEPPKSSTAPAAAKTKIEAPRYGTWGFDIEGMDRTVKPGDDFFAYANGAWAKKTTIPADKTSFGAFAMLRDLSEARVRAILDKWAADKSLKAGSDEAKVAAIYRTFLDEAAAEKLDSKPIQPYLDAVKNAKSHEDIAKLMAKAPQGFGRTFFNFGISDDQKDPTSTRSTCRSRASASRTASSTSARTSSRRKSATRSTSPTC